MKPMYQKAFTLLEMVFVIVILGIVAGISSEVIATAYESYINQRAVYKSSIKTELAATQIVNRLAYAIPGSIVGRKANGTLTDVSNMPALANNDYIALQWIGYDIDGFTTRDVLPGAGDTPVNRRSGWSGFADLGATARIDPANPASNVQLVTPGSNLPLSNAIIATLSARGPVRGLVGSAFYFNIDGLAIHDGVATYNLVGTDGIYAVNNPLTINATNDALELTGVPANAGRISEQYKIAWTSYAIVITDGDGDGNNDLVLRYNFQPWNGITFQNQAVVANQQVLLSNVSVFRFTGSESSIRFKICKPERTGTDTEGNPITVAVCKEKVVIK